MAEQYQEDTKNGRFNLIPAEKIWRDLQPTLQRRGYRLRPRYDKAWRPSWAGTNIDPFWCEDSLKPDVGSCEIYVSDSCLTLSN